MTCTVWVSETGREAYVLLGVFSFASCQELRMKRIFQSDEVTANNAV